MAYLQGSTVIGETSETINLYDARWPQAISAVGSSGDDLIRGNELNNCIYGNDGDDYIWGGCSGNDTLVGGNGNNAYWWGSGNGADTIISTSGGDVLVEYNLADGAHAGWFEGSDLVISVASDSLRFSNWLTTPTTKRFQSFICADNVAYAWNGGAIATVNLFDRPYADWNVNHVKAANGTGDCVLRGGSLSDVIEGGSGNDQIWGGSGGNDVMNGGGGTDTFWWGGEKDGVDTITYNADNYKDTVRLYGVTSKDKITASLNGYDYILTIGGGALTIQNWRVSSLEKLQFDDSVVMASSLLSTTT